ncbi:MAG: DUF721 domain-containing protein [Methylococcales symbiont of Iophon sp. n. MRB-2018]|nr:MAG: DUF721 domain-containing protein [Methylococcales symbiont of Iophon sp. n. MRB-2018]KAF3979995.1 MAG: DUF721 domain-containing protein [Methylococcales symbiont of Iophon sp. n. MRB-2018]
MAKNNFFKSALAYEGKVFSYYKQQQKIQQNLLNTIKASLPDRLACHALYCVVTEKKILVYTDSAIWSSQLRFYHQQMLEKLLASNQGYFEVLQIKIIPAVVEGENKLSNIIPSKENISLILEQANNQTDASLKNALLKLATTLNKLSKQQKLVNKK